MFLDRGAGLGGTGCKGVTDASGCPGSSSCSFADIADTLLPDVSDMSSLAAGETGDSVDGDEAGDDKHGLQCHSFSNNPLTIWRYSANLIPENHLVHCNITS